MGRCGTRRWRVWRGAPRGLVRLRPCPRGPPPRAAPGPPAPRTTSRRRALPAVHNARRVVHRRTAMYAHHASGLVEAERTGGRTRMNVFDMDTSCWIRLRSVRPLIYIRYIMECLSARGHREVFPIVFSAISKAVDNQRELRCLTRSTLESIKKILCLMSKS